MNDHLFKGEKHKRKEFIMTKKSKKCEFESGIKVETFTNDWGRKHAPTTEIWNFGKTTWENKERNNGRKKSFVGILS